MDYRYMCDGYGDVRQEPGRAAAAAEEELAARRAQERRLQRGAEPHPAPRAALPARPLHDAGGRAMALDAARLRAQLRAQLAGLRHSLATRGRRPRRPPAAPTRQQVASPTVRAGETGDPRENPPTNGIIVRHDSHVRKSSEPAGDRTQFALVGGERANRLATAAPRKVSHFKPVKYSDFFACLGTSVSLIVEVILWPAVIWARLSVKREVGGPQEKGGKRAGKRKLDTRKLNSINFTTLFYPVQAGKKRVKFSYGKSSQALPWESYTCWTQYLPSCFHSKAMRYGAMGFDELLSPTISMQKFSRNAHDADALRRNMIHPDWLQLIATHRCIELPTIGESDSPRLVSTTVLSRIRILDPWTGGPLYGVDTGGPRESAGANMAASLQCLRYLYLTARPCLDTLSPAVATTNFTMADFLLAAYMAWQPLVRWCIKCAFAAMRKDFNWRAVLISKVLTSSRTVFTEPSRRFEFMSFEQLLTYACAIHVVVEHVFPAVTTPASCRRSRSSSDNAEWTPCVLNVRSFTSAFLFSVETQHSIGYGSRSTTEECPEAIFLMVLQAPLPDFRARDSCRTMPLGWPADFLGDLPFLPSSHSDAAPYSPPFATRPTFSTPLKKRCPVHTIRNYLIKGGITQLQRQSHYTHTHVNRAHARRSCTCAGCNITKKPIRPLHRSVLRTRASHWFDPADPRYTILRPYRHESSSIQQPPWYQLPLELIKKTVKILNREGRTGNEHGTNYENYVTQYSTEPGLLLLFSQAITGLLIEACMMGVVFAKLARPKQRTQTLLFSKHAVVCQRDRELCFKFRVGDMRKSHIINAKVRALFISSKLTSEGELLPHYRQANANTRKHLRKCRKYK
ncbi:hypothetical protein PR048_002633 [Dryococelus australis]|uniref:Uncharacterized protein n=1 Tax=Dryococelus australis TaxID=614101 RepID=A0ABQ9IKT7_9NEOP|nr:hypothetical protein PR048_002633 [Dryococelus australis]